MRCIPGIPGIGITKHFGQPRINGNNKDNRYVIPGGHLRRFFFNFVFVLVLCVQ